MVYIQNRTYYSLRLMAMWYYPKYKYTWNEDDRLVAITKQGESTPYATYKYDDDGRRIEKTVNGQTTRYHYDGDSINVLYETDTNGNVLRQYVYGVDSVRVAMKSQGQTLYYHYNPHGDVIAMTDANGNVVAQYGYDTWGNVLKNTAQGIAADNPFGYAGYMYDKEIGMYYLIARYYNPGHGVFLSADPDPGDEDDPVTQNGYTYGDNNPVMMTDPDGHVAWWAVAGGIGAATGVAKYLYQNRNKGYTWKGGLKAAGKGALNGVAWAGIGRTVGFISKGKALGRIVQKRDYRPSFRQATSNIKRFMKNPIKHLKRTPGARLEGMAKAKKKRIEAFNKSTKAKLMRASNAIGRRR